MKTTIHAQTRPSGTIRACAHRPIRRVRGAVVTGLLAGLLLLPGLGHAQLVNGTYKVTETWQATLSYSGFADPPYTGTETYSGTQSGTIVVTNGNYQIIDKTGIAWSDPRGNLKNRFISGYGGNYSISGDYPFVPAYGSKAYGLVFVACFAVRVPFRDGEVPAFTSYRDYSASGPLSVMNGYGYMHGVSLDADVSSTVSWTKVVGPPTPALKQCA